MESFEQLCKVALEAEGFVVTGNVKFFVRRKTRKAAYDEFQEHGYEVDLVGARADRLILASVKSYLGSRGVNRQNFVGLADTSKPTDYGGYKIFNDAELRRDVVAAACTRYGYGASQVEMRLYVGKFARGHQNDVKRHLAERAVKVVTLPEILDAIVAYAGRKTYVDDPVVMTVKALAADHRLVEVPNRSARPADEHG